jgi:hypothetical protein
MIVFSIGVTINILQRTYNAYKMLYKTQRIIIKNWIYEKE